MALTKIDDRGLKTPIDLLDSEKIRLGTGNDLAVYHNGTDSIIDFTENVHNLRIMGNNEIRLEAKFNELSLKAIKNGAVELYYDNVKRFETLATGVKITGDLLLANASNNISILDNGRIKLGTGDDLRLYHNGVQSYIDNHTGRLKIRSNAVKISNLAEDHTYILTNEDGSSHDVKLYYDNVKKLETSSGGVTVTGTVTATAFSGGGIIPSGGIIIWSGASNAIPTGFLLCDGSNSTPDLRDRFIVGAGNSYSVGATGGANSVTLTTAQIPSHNHSIQIRLGKDDDNFSFNQGFSSDAPTSGGTFNSNNTGGGQSHENRPPYYALCYIMKS